MNSFFHTHTNFRPFLSIIFIIITVINLQAQLHRYTFTMPAMGTEFKMVLYAPNPAIAWNAVRAAYDKICQIEKIFSDYDDDSEISRLCATAGTGQWIKVSEELWFILNFAISISQKTEGAFDVTIGPYSNLWRRARRKHMLPDSDLLNEAKKSVGYNYIKLDASTKSVLLEASRMRLDFGGIVKGYAIDQALEVLRSKGLNHVLIAASGDHRLGEPPPDHPYWIIEAPFPTQSDCVRLCLKDVAIATSGDMYQYLEINGNRYSHIIDPRTGYALTKRIQTTVIAHTGLLADTLATAICVLHPDRSLELIKSFPGVEARIYILENQNWQIITSSGFNRYVCPTPEREP